MREYDDDNIRLYTPIFQRIIILAAVIIAVPVVMWTITAFVRTYVAPPKVPTFQRMTEDEPSANPPDLPAAAPETPAPMAAPPSRQAQAGPPSAQMTDASSSAGDARTPLLEIKKPVSGGEPQAAPPAVTPAAPMAAPQIAATIPPPAIQLAPAASAQPTADAAPAAPAAPTAPAAPALAAPPMPAVANSARKRDSIAAPAASDRAIAWPNPQSNVPPGIGIDSATAASAPPPAVPREAAASDTAGEDALPAAKPIPGPIPLPRRRPNEVAMLQPSLQAGIAGGVPLPRARPATAPADTSGATNDVPGSSYQPGMESGHY